MVRYWYRLKRNGKWGWRRHYWVLRDVLLVSVIGLSACGQLQCDLLGSDTLREQCRDNEVIMTIYAVPTYFPGGL